MSKNQVATSNTAIQTAMPAFLQGKTSARGQENVTSSDLIIPRLEIVQSLSPCRKKTDAAYIEGAEEGLLYNNVTRELYGESVMLVPVFYKKEWLVWKDRTKGGGFRGAFQNELEAKHHINSLDTPEDYFAQDTANHFCLIVKADGTAEDIVVSMSKSKLKTSRKWNSLIRLASGDSFSRVYKLIGVEQTNANNDTFYGFDVVNAGFPTEAIYNRAEELYNAVSEGRATAQHDEDDL